MEFKVQKLNTSQLKNRLKRDRPYVLVDVREMEAFIKGHIPRASNVHDGKVMAMVKQISKGTDIILYGPDSAGNTKLFDDVAEKFMNLGSKYIFTYEAGFKEWADSGNNVDRSKQKLT